MKRTFLSMLALALLATVARAEPVKENSPAPAFTVKTLAGKTLRLSALRGSVVLLDFGAVNCPPCRLEMPILQGFHKKYKAKGLRIVGLMQMNPTVAEVKKMLQERGVTYPVAVDTKEEIGKRYGLIAHPTTVLIDRAGKVVKVETGYVKGDEKAIERAIVAQLTPVQGGAP